jgi:uncharacterized membrane protein YagU involved in acid resistance
MPEMQGTQGARRSILTGGLLAGGLDLLWVCANSAAQGRPPSRILQSIASGVLGSSAYEAGGSAMALGVVLHFTIALGAATTYHLLGRRWPGLHRRYLVAGPLFGVGVYFFMQLVVLPLSHVPWKTGFSSRGLLLGLAAHVLCVGLPIAWAARHGAPTRPD